MATVILTIQSFDQKQPRFTVNKFVSERDIIPKMMTGLIKDFEKTEVLFEDFLDSLDYNGKWFEITFQGDSYPEDYIQRGRIKLPESECDYYYLISLHKREIEKVRVNDLCNLPYENFMKAFS